jgi:hypothetical protein
MSSPIVHITGRQGATGATGANGSDSSKGLPGGVGGAGESIGSVSLQVCAPAGTVPRDVVLPHPINTFVDRKCEVNSLQGGWRRFEGRVNVAPESMLQLVVRGGKGGRGGSGGRGQDGAIGAKCVFRRGLGSRWGWRFRWAGLLCVFHEWHKPSDAVRGAWHGRRLRG